MRPTRLLALVCFLGTALAGISAQAAPPVDPFAPARPALGDTRAPLPDPFEDSRTPSGSRTPALKDPFARTAPVCPVRTTDNGIVIQRPANVACDSLPRTHALADPFAS